MKKNALYLFAAVSGLLLLPSCKRDYVCTCYSYNNDEISARDTTINKVPNRDAIFYCDQIEREAIYNYTIGLTNDTVMYCNLSKK